MHLLPHSRRLIQTALITLCLFAGALPINSQVQQEKKPEKQPEKQDDQQTATIRVDTDLVSIDVTVTNSTGGRSVTGLNAEDFVIYEDGVRQKISNFSTTGAFNLVLVMDTSGSTQDQVTLMRRAARRFLDELRPQDRIAVIEFNEKVELLEDLTADRGKIEKAISLLKPGEGTSFYDALQLTIEEVLKPVEGRKAIIALTDGVDSYGFGTFDQIVPGIEKAGASIYFLELDTEAFTEAGILRDCRDHAHFEFSQKQLKKYLNEYAEGADPSDYESHCHLSKMERMQINRRLYESARRELREMASKSGGRVYPVKQLQQLEPAYAQIASDLRTQYSLGYYPTNDKHDGKWRTLRVEVKRSGLVVNTRPGYRAPKD